MNKQTLFFILILCISSILTGCNSSNIETIEEEFGKPLYKPKYVVTIHQIITNSGAKQLEKTVPTVNSGAIKISTIPVFDSRDIIEAKLVKSDKPKFYNLSLKLSDVGEKKWMILCHGHKSETLSFCVDMVHQQNIYPCLLKGSQSNWILLKGPFYGKLAEEIVKYSKKNYKYYNH